jgi:gamma-glutamyltranspeptidase
MTEQSLHDAGAQQPHFAGQYAVAAPHALASEAGARVLRAGGNAVDAMVAVNAALAVVYPHMTGMGGDAFWLIFDAHSGRVHALNASGRTARAATLKRYRLLGPTISRRGAQAALTVPGAVDGWCTAHSRFGVLPLPRCLEDAIEYADQGVAVCRGVARAMAAHYSTLTAHPDTARTFLQGGIRPYARGETMCQPQLADTLRKVADRGRIAFYEGDIATTIGGALAAAGGVLNEEDFAAHRSDWEEPLTRPYRNVQAITTGPNSQGFVHHHMLSLLEHFQLGDLEDPEAVDLVIRAAEIAGAARDRRLADETAAERRIETLFEPERLAVEAEQMRMGSRTPSLPRSVSGDTTFSCTVDGAGNAVGVIQSIFFEWGSGIVGGDSGVLMQNRGTSCSLDATRPDRLAPGKRPFSTLVSSMLLDSATERPRLVYGSMGGLAQPQTQTTLVTRILDRGASVADAIDHPRWVLGPIRGEAPHRRVRLEDRAEPHVVAHLRRCGHEVEMIEGYSDLVGHAQAIETRTEGLSAAADPRADGLAIVS